MLAYDVTNNKDSDISSIGLILLFTIFASDWQASGQGEHKELTAVLLHCIALRCMDDDGESERLTTTNFF